MKKLFSALLMGVFILTSVSVFTSCKDNDDDIKAIREDVAALRAELTNVKAALETELQSSKSMFETQIAQVKKELQDAIDKKADEATVSALREKLTGLETDYKAKMAVVEAQLEAANQALSKLDDKADKATVDNVIATVAALTGQLADESKAREAIEANLQIQIEALKKLRQELSDANYQGQIDGLIQACQNFDTTVADVNVMKKTINNLELQLTNFNQYISALEVLVERMLNSISLVPQLFVGGIEAIEFVTLKYQEYDKDYDRMRTKSWYILDKGETEATYRLNPSTTPREGIDENNIEFLAATAETRAIEVASPVIFKGIKDYRNGLMTVYLKKADAFRNTRLGDETDPNPSIYIVALKVPRNAAQYEAANVISENSRLVERWYSPRIAANNSGTWHANWSGTREYYDGINNDLKTVKIDRPKHYWEYKDFWVSPMLRVDSNPLEGVAEVVDYDKTFNVSDIVTGCLYEYTTTYPFAGNCVRKIDVDELEKYGIEINYSIPTEYYGTPASTVDHSTNQQEFAEITDTKLGTIKSKTPAGVSDNKAVIGKEPVVKIQMKDVINNKVIDERYLKIKWSDKRIDVKKVELTIKDRDKKFKPCDADSVQLTWREVVNQVYAQITNLGISEQVFREVYWTPTPDRVVSWTTNWPNNYATLTSAPRSGSGGPLPTFQETTNQYGDAIIAEWWFNPSDIKTVYCSSKDDTKTFTARVTFKSRDKRYPDIWFDWKVTFHIDQLPELVGVYDQYWLDGKVGEEHDILPLQYKSDMQRWWQDLAPVADRRNFCFFDNNLMNPFAYETPNGFIVKNIPECGSWDIQFAYNQSIANHKPNYTPNASSNVESVYETGDGHRIYRSGGKEVDTHNFADMTNLIPWRDFGAYQYWLLPIVSGNGNQLLQMTWPKNQGDNIDPLTLTDHSVDGPHKAWWMMRGETHRRTYLWADHYKGTYNYDNRDANTEWKLNRLNAVLNELDQNPANDITRADGTKEPKRTHTKPLDINIWGALNAWNYIPVKSYKAYMVAPLRLNVNSGKDWYDGQVDGSPVKWYDLITLTDFRGYLVKYVSNNTYPSEQQRWTMDLWNYYEVKAPEVLTSEAKFAFQVVGNSVIINNSLPKSSWLTSDDLYRRTNGNVDISFERRGDYIYFWNNGGSRIEGEVKVWIPILLDYGLGRFDGRKDDNSGIEAFVKPHV